MFIGKFPAKMRTRLALTLQQYAAALPLLTALQAQGQFLCIDVHMHQRSMVDSLRNEREMQRLEMRLEEEQRRQEAEQRRLEMRLEEEQRLRETEQRRLEMRLEEVQRLREEGNARLAAVEALLADLLKR